MESQPLNHIDVQNVDGDTFLQGVATNSVDLVLTDPPYIISSETGMNSHFNSVQANAEEGGENVRTDEEWHAVRDRYLGHTTMPEEQMRSNYLKFGTIYGKKYCVKTDYGDWDKDFTMEELELSVKEYYRILKKGGTAIIFFDIWKITPLKAMMEKHKFKQIRYIEWIKTNPQPLNSKRNYLTNCREMALLGVKGGKPTFNSEYDNSIYMFPIQGGRIRTHPTQKNTKLFEALIEKHSNPGDMVVDTFLGSGTTARACKNTGRKFSGCEISEEYYANIVASLTDH